MAFRIHDSVVRGAIDNRIKGIVRGTIWLEGWTEPLTIELQGNAHPDLAGCLLTFTNPRPRVHHPNLDSLTCEQRGVAGDLTASRKVRVLGVPVEETSARSKGKERPPERLANTLYLEWFSETNGRVVIESADYKVAISAPAWQLTPEEDEQRARETARALEFFLEKLTGAIDQQKRAQKDPDEPWNEHDYERLMKEGDARAEKYGELLDKFGDSDEAESRIAKEMGWERERSEEEAEEERLRIEEMNRACEEALHEPPPAPDPHREGIDWIRTKTGDLRHPLQHRCFESAIKFWRQLEALGLERLADKGFDDFVFEFQTTSVKLGGALGSLAEGYGSRDHSFTVACLKRALAHLHKAQAGLEALAPKRLLPPEIVTEARRELFEIREEILKLMNEFRGQGDS